MADYASIAGGSGEPLSFSAVPGGVDAFYHIDTSRFLDLSARTGDSTVDATGQDHGMALVLGHGSDAATTGDGNDVVLGGSGTDTITTGAGDDFVLGNGGADAITLGAGDDAALGGTGADTLYGQAGDDTLFGDAGDDVLAGGAGADLLVGGTGADLLSGGAGDDGLFGGTGADTLIGGAGDDFAMGGAGGDTFVYGSDFGRDVIVDFGAGDKLQFASDLNGSGIEVPADLVKFISGGAGVTKIIIGDSTITLQGVDKDAFLAHLNTNVQII